jgi:hypothetical protein
MKTVIDKNETELQKMKRESLEWIERYGKNAPPFIFVAVNAFEVPVREYPTTPFSKAYKEQIIKNGMEFNE